MRVPSERVAKASMPRSIPVSCPVAGKGCADTSAHEIATYQPSASLLIVTVLGIPWRGRLQRIAIRPTFDTTRKPLPSRAPFPCQFHKGERMPTSTRLIAGEVCFLARLHTTEERLIGLVESRQHILQYM